MYKFITYLKAEEWKKKKTIKYENNIIFNTFRNCRTSKK